jgi:hypothetical protein
LLQASEFARMSDFKIAPSRRIRRNSLLISLLAGNLRVETGSTATASATTQFPESLFIEPLREKPALARPIRHVFSGCVEHVRPLQEARERLAILAIANEAEASGRRNPARDAVHVAAPAPKREVEGHVSCYCLRTPVRTPRIIRVCPELGAPVEPIQDIGRMTLGEHSNGIAKCPLPRVKRTWPRRVLCPLGAQSGSRFSPWGHPRLLLEASIIPF